MQSIQRSETLFAKLHHYMLLMRFHRPIGTFLLLWPTLWALWLASQGKPALYLIIIFILGVVIMRAAGSVINDIADRHFDGQVHRTQARPLVTGQVTVKEALLLFTSLCVCALGLVLLLNRFTQLLAVAGLALAIIYPFTKRFFVCPQLILGVTFSWCILMAFAAQAGYLSRLAWLVFSINLVLTIAYDTMYAMTDKQDDLRIGIRSSAILFAGYDRIIIACLQGITMTLLIILGILAELNYLYFIALAIAAGLFIYQQMLIKNREPARCFKAFLNNNWFGMIIFLGIMLSYYNPSI